MSERFLIVNGDDFGRSPGVNAGIVQAHARGILTSATLMVRWPDAERAAASARTGTISIGLHLDLGEWVYRDEQWQVRYEVVESQTEATVREEIERQLESFERLMGRPPTHLDSHQHVHEHEPVRSALLEVGERLGVVVRNHSPAVRYSGAFYGQDGRGNPYREAISAASLIALVEGLEPGTTEIGCHPAAEADHESTYGIERVQELETLCDPRVREAIDRCGVVLRPFTNR